MNTVTIEQAEQAEQLFRDVHYRLIRLSRHQLMQHRMSPPRFHLLHHIVRDAPVTMGAVHAHMHLSRSSLTSLVDGLVEDGLISRSRAPDDRRRVVLVPTRAGLELLEDLRMTRSDCLRRAFAGLDRGTIESFTRSLKHVADALDAQPTPGGPAQCDR